MLHLPCIPHKVSLYVYHLGYCIVFDINTIIPKGYKMQNFNGYGIFFFFSYYFFFLEFCKGNMIFVFSLEELKCTVLIL